MTDLSPEDDLSDLLGPEPVEVEAPTLDAPEAEPVGEPKPVAAPVVAKKRGPFDNWSDDDIENMPDLEWLIGDDRRPVLLEGGLWQTIGLLKSAKTFFTMEAAFCVAFELPFHGMPVKQGQVVYILAEGGIKRNYRRVRALWIKHGPAITEKWGYKTLKEARASGKLILIDQTIGLAAIDPRSPTGPRAFLAAMKAQGIDKPALIVLDTWARALWEAGGNDSDAATVGPSVQACEMIRKTLGGAALIMVAHIGASKDAQGRAKGLTDPAGAIDGGTLCRKIERAGKETIYTFKAVHQRHAEEGFTLECTLKSPAPKGMSAPSVCLYSDGTVTLAKLSPSALAWFDALTGLGGTATLKVWREAGVKAGIVAGEGKAVTQSYSRARRELAERSAISVDNDVATATPERMSNADDFEAGGDDDFEGGDGGLKP